MNKTLKILIITAIAVAMLVAGIFSTNNLTKAQQTTSGVVTIAFDDGEESQIRNAFPLMQQHGFVGTYYIITDNVGADDYMNLTELHTLQDAGNEIGSHSADHPDFIYLTDDQINEECNASQHFLQSNGFPATNFAYPYGEANSHTDSIVLQYYKSARHSYLPEYLSSIPPTSIQMSIPMGFAGETGDSNALIQDETVVRWAHETNSWVIIFFHNILTTPLTTPWEIEQSNFASFLNYVGNSSVQVLTVNQALNLWSSSQKVTALPSSSDSLYPYSSIAMDVDQVQTFTASAYGGTGPYMYQWYLEGTAVGNSNNFDFAPSSPGIFSLYVNSTDSALVPVTSMSNTESITVNPALVAPTVTSTPSTVDQGQTSSLTSSSVTTGTSPYTYQWLQKSP